VNSALSPKLAVRRATDRSGRERTRRPLTGAIAGLLLALALASPASADTITVGNGLDETATVVCEFNAQTNTFTFTITNTSAITQRGSTASIISIGFDLPPIGNASASGLNGFTGQQAPSLSANFTFSDAALGKVKGAKAAVLDFGFVTGSEGKFDKGKVADGLAPGESASFTVSGASFTGFTEEQICTGIFLRFKG
jgi:hypothetical protein